MRTVDIHSRALQAYTLHYYQITCGTSTATGTFQTANIPLGATSPEVYPVDPANPGKYAWPNMNQSLGAGESIIDPLTGALLRRITGVNTVVDTTYTNLPNLGAFDDSGSTNPWSITGNALPATYAANGTTQPKMYVPANMASATNYGPTSSSFDTINWIQVAVTGTATGSGDDAKAQMCLTIDGATCAPGAPNIQEVAFTSTSSTQNAPASPQPGLSDWFGWLVPPFNVNDVATRSITASYNSTTGTLTWTGNHYFERNWAAGTRVWISGAPYRLTGYTDSEHVTLASGLGISATPTVTGQSFGVLIWKKTNTPGTSITISGAKFNSQPSQGNFSFWNGGDARQCNPNAVTLNGESGFYCQLYGNNGFSWIGSQTGTVLHLGQMFVKYSAGSGGNGWNNEPFWNTGSYVWDPTRTASSYFVNYDSNNKYVLGRVDYNGTNTDIPSQQGGSYGYAMAQVTPAAILTPYCNGTPCASNVHYDLKTLLYNFEAQITSQTGGINRFAACYNSSGCGCVLIAEQGNYLIGRCYGGQDTPPADVFVLDPRITPGPTATPVVGLLDFVNAGSAYPNPLRWSVMHAGGLGNYPWVRVGFNNATDAHYQTTLAQAITSATATDVYVSSEPGSGYYDIARVGDIFKLGNSGSYAPSQDCYEVMQITAIPTPGSHWVVTRNYGLESLGACAHSSGATITMRTSGSDLGMVAWDYIDDPHGLNANGNTVMQDPVMSALGHNSWNSWNTLIRIAGDGVSPYCPSAFGSNVHMCYETRTAAYPGSGTYTQSGWNNGVYTCPWCWNMPPDTIINDRPGFASLQPPDSITENHPSMVQDAAAPWNRNWFLDSRPLIYSGFSEYTNISKVASTNNLYVTTQTLHPKVTPTIASCGEHPLLNASPGPLTDSASDNWKYCTGASCYAGATASQTYVNCPDRTLIACHNGTDSGVDANGDTSEDICIGDGIWSLGAPLAQIDGTKQDFWGRYQRVITYGFMRYRQQPVDYISNGKALPDGSWATFTTPWVDNQRCEMFLAKLPPWPQGGSANRGTFTPLPVQIGSMPAGATNVAVQFGYNPSFYCTSRQEACIANQSTINETTPFYWASESYSGLACASGCTVAIPAVANRVVYYRTQYRTASGAVLATSATAAAVVP